MRWIVIVLKPNQSKRAEENLANQEFLTFFPKITYLSNGKLITKDLFPGYGFIGFTEPDKLISISSTKGVSRVMRINDSLPVIEESVIQAIKKQLNYFNSQVAVRIPFAINDRVIINLKILNNQEAEVINVLNKKDSQILLLKILNSSQTIWVNGKHVETKQELKI